MKRLTTNFIFYTKICKNEIEVFKLFINAFIWAIVGRAGSVHRYIDTYRYIHTYFSYIIHRIQDESFVSLVGISIR